MTAKPASREEKLAAALRENLRKRKQQQRTRKPAPLAIEERSDARTQ